MVQEGDHQKLEHRVSGIKPGQSAAVFGPGPIGLLMIQLLKAAGAGQIIVTGTSADGRRFEIAKQLGADVIIDVSKEDPVKRIKEIAGSLDFVFEATGISRTISQGLQMLHWGGESDSHRHSCREHHLRHHRPCSSAKVNHWCLWLR